MTLLHIVDYGKQNSIKYHGAINAHDDDNNEKYLAKALNSIEPSVVPEAQIYDKIDRLVECDIPIGNICVAGTTKEIHSIATYLTEHSSVGIETLTVLEFSKLSTKKQIKNKDCLRIIAVDTERSSTEFIHQITSKCVRSFMFRPQNMMLFCKFSGIPRVNGYAMRIISSFADSYGEDKVGLLERIYATEEGEFVEFGLCAPRARRLLKKAKKNQRLGNPCKM